MDILKRIRNKRFQNEVAKWLYHRLCGTLGGPRRRLPPFNRWKKLAGILKNSGALKQEEL
jgi:hypothetical protein